MTLRSRRCLYKFPLNDRAAFFDLYARHKHDLAAVMIEPAGTCLGKALASGCRCPRF